MVYVRAMSAQNRKIDVFLVKFSSQKDVKNFFLMSPLPNALICYLDQIEIGQNGKYMYSSYWSIHTNISTCCSYVSPL